MKKAILYHFLSGPSYGADVSAYVAKLNEDGVTKPSGTVLAAMDVLMQTLRAAFPTELDTINIYGFGSVEAGKYNLVNVETYEHTFPAGSPTFLEGSGIKSNLTTYVDTEYAVNEFAGVETMLTTVLYVSESSIVFGTPAVFGCRGTVASSNSGTDLQTLTTSATGARRGYGAQDSFSNTNHKGLYILTYNGTSAVIYKDYDGIGGGIKDSQVVTPTAPDVSSDMHFLARNISTADGNTPTLHYPYYSVLLLRLRKQFTDGDAATIYNAWNVFKGSVGLASFVISAGVWNFEGLFSFSGTFNL